jgi:hypothetical protein
MNHDAVGLPVWPKIDDAIGTLMTVWMLVARRVDVASHHFAAVDSHSRVIARLSNVCNGSKADGKFGWKADISYSSSRHSEERVKPTAPKL